jgi:ATP-dependent Clp protease protease subunit
MNNVVKRILLVVGIITIILALPKSALTEKNDAPAGQIVIRQSEQLPKLLPVITDTTNNASIPVRTLDTKGAAIVQLNTEFTEKSVDEVIAGIKQANREQKKMIYLTMDSPGGDVHAGGRLIAAMGSSKAPVYTVVTGLCASMCAITEEYGKERYMLDRTSLMFHPASMQVQIAGEVDKIISRLQYGQTEINKMDVHTATRSGQSYTDFKAKTEREYWVDAEDALHDHLIDAIVDIDFVKVVPPTDESAFGKSIRQYIKNINW